MLQFGRAARTQAQRFSADTQSSRIGYFNIDRHVFECHAPVTGLDHHGDVHGVARAVDAAVAKDVGRHLVGNTGAAEAADIKAREVEHTISLIER